MLCVLCRAVKSAWRAAYVAFVAEMQSTARLDMLSTTDAPRAEKPKLTIQTPPDGGIGNRRSSLTKQSSTGSIADRSSDTALGARRPRPEWTSLDHKDTNPIQRSLTSPLKTEMLSQPASFGRSPSSSRRSPRFSMVTFASPMEQAMTLLRRAALPSSSMDSSSVKKLLDEAIELLGVVTSTASSAALGASSSLFLTKVDVAGELARHVKETGGDDLDSASDRLGVPLDCTLITSDDLPHQAKTWTVTQKIGSCRSWNKPARLRQRLRHVPVVSMPAGRTLRTPS